MRARSPRSPISMQRAMRRAAPLRISPRRRAATFGAIETLIVDMDVVVPGTVNEETGAIEFAKDADAANYGVVDEIARRALQSGAKVMSGRRADIPGGGDLAAILRYPL